MTGILIGGGAAHGLGAALAKALGGGEGDDLLSPQDRARAAELRREDGEDPEIYLHKLREALAAEQSLVPHVFKVGDLVKHRDGERVSIFTAKRPGIVVEVLARPVFANDEKWSSADFRKLLDLRIGAIRGGEFMIWHGSSRDYEPARGS